MMDQSPKFIIGLDNVMISLKEKWFLNILNTKK